VSRLKPIVSTARPDWYAAFKTTGIKSFRWHDIRKTRASWQVQNGTTLLELKELGGWTDYRSVLVYAHLGSQHLAKCVNLPVGSATLKAIQVKQEMAQAVQPLVFAMHLKTRYFMQFPSSGYPRRFWF
jgi:hypothetical protein